MRRFLCEGMARSRLAFSCIALVVCQASASEPIEIVWPTPNRAWLEGNSIESIIQPTQSGDTESGLFGCTRTGGRQYHEGIDIKPMRRDSRGEAEDEVFAAMDGVVRHVASRSGDSSYGRYIVIEHPLAKPTVITLYAHLARIHAGIAEGVSVRRGQAIGVMGRSAGGYAIPRDRAHLHFEIGLYATRQFQAWYQARRFGSPNQHGIWNGMNLLGLNPLDVFRMAKATGSVRFEDVFSQLDSVITLKIASRRIPDFIQRYPSLLRKPMPMGLIGGWEISCHWSGMPIVWTPLDPLQTATMKPNEIQILNVDDALLRKHKCRHLVDTKRGKRVPGKDLDAILDQIFLLR